MNLSSFKIRIRIVSVLIFFIAGILILKLFFVQVINKNLYAEKADKQYATPASDIFNRGTIYFSKNDGTLVAAASVSSGFKIALNTKNIVDKESLYKALDPYIEMDKNTFLSRASKLNDPYEEIEKHLNKELK